MKQLFLFFDRMDGMNEWLSKQIFFGRVFYSQLHDEKMSLMPYGFYVMNNFSELKRHVKKKTTAQQQQNALKIETVY